MLHAQNYGGIERGPHSTESSLESSTIPPECSRSLLNCLASIEGGKLGNAKPAGAIAAKGYLARVFDALARMFVNLHAKLQAAKIAHGGTTSNPSVSRCSLQALWFEKMWADMRSQHGKYASKWKWSNGCPHRQPMQVHRRRSGARNGSRRTVAAAIRNCHPGFALHSRLSNTYLVGDSCTAQTKSFDFNNSWDCRKQMESVACRSGR